MTKHVRWSLFPVLLSKCHVVTIFKKMLVDRGTEGPRDLVRSKIYFCWIQEFCVFSTVEPKVARPQNKHFVKNIPTAGIPAVAFLYKIQRVKEYEEEVMTKHLRTCLTKTCTKKKFISWTVVKMSCCHTFSEKLKWPRDRGTEGPGDTFSSSKHIRRRSLFPGLLSKCHVVTLFQRS